MSMFDPALVSSYNVGDQADSFIIFQIVPNTGNDIIKDR